MAGSFSPDLVIRERGRRGGEPNHGIRMEQSLDYLRNLKEASIEFDPC
jgi:hypothetical protein